MNIRIQTWGLWHRLSISRHQLTHFRYLSSTRCVGKGSSGSDRSLRHCGRQVCRRQIRFPESDANIIVRTQIWNGIALHGVQAWKTGVWLTFIGICTELWKENKRLIATLVLVLAYNDREHGANIPPRSRT